VVLHCQFGVTKVRISECTVHGVKCTLGKRHLLINGTIAEPRRSFALNTLHPVQVLDKVGIVSHMVLL
jgi:hypothetical protein